MTICDNLLADWSLESLNYCVDWRVLASFDVYLLTYILHSAEHSDFHVKMLNTCLLNGVMTVFRSKQLI